MNNKYHEPIKHSCFKDEFIPTKAPPRQFANPKTLKGITPKSLGAKISYNERQGKARHVRIQMPDDTEYELNFPPDAKDDQILMLTMEYWRII